MLFSLFKKAKKNWQADYLEFLFTALGNLAKSSGRVKDTHIQYTSQLIDQFGFDQLKRNTAIKWFNQGKLSRQRCVKLAYPICADLSNQNEQNNEQKDTHFNNLQKTSKKKHNPPEKRTDAEILRQAILTHMCQITAISPANQAVGALHALGQMIGFSGSHIKQRFALACSTEYAPTEEQIPQAVIDAYDCLDIAVTDNEVVPSTAVKQAYRRMVARYHPDRLSKDATPAECALANRRMVQIKEALETIEAYPTEPS